MLSKTISGTSIWGCYNFHLYICRLFCIDAV